MGYQVPPTLPDYSKLVFMLNSAGVQKWNPAVYDVLKNLIEAVQQSQDTFVETVIPAAIEEGGFSGVSVNGALSGNGLPSSPLAVKVDNTTIQIVGDQLVALGLGHAVTANFAANIPAGTTVSALVPAPGASKVILPLVAVAQTSYLGYTTGRSLNIRYNGNATNIVTLANVIQGGGVAQTGAWFYGTIVNAGILRTAGEISNKAIDVVFSGANSAFTAGDVLTVDVWYLTYNLSI